MDDPRYHSRRWRELRAQVLKRDGPFCSVPGCQTDMSSKHQVQVDHILELKDGGDFWDPVNLQVLCKIHHSAKSLMQAGARLTRKAKLNLEPTSPNG